MKKETLVIAGFPGTGKSYFFRNTDFNVLDSDSSEFSWVKDENGNNTKERNPLFPSNYMEHIKENIGKADIIFISTHDVVRGALKEAEIKYILVYPESGLKEEYLDRYRNRGSVEGFVNLMDKQWDTFLDEIHKEAFPTKVELISGQTMVDVVALQNDIWFKDEAAK